MNNSSLSQINWSQIDTFLVDMDGTLLDLAFDTRFWLRTLPSHIAQMRNCSFETALELVTNHHDETKGTLKWYCIDHWGDRMEVDIRTLKYQQKHLIRWLPGAQSFMQSLAALPAKKWLATNAHPYILSLKQQQLSIQSGFDRAITCHEFDAPKETKQFWSSLEAYYDLDLSRTVMIDDSTNVLEAAAAAGVGYPIEILNPDSEFAKPATTLQGDNRIMQIDGVADLIDVIQPFTTLSA